MKKLLLAVLLSITALSLSSQNLQLHFDPRHGLHSDVTDRNYFTATFEMFKADKWGSTFMFVDLDFNQSRGNIGLAYMEIMRDQNLGKLPIKAHIEFNGGLASFGTIPNAYLLGASYPMQFGKLNLNTYVAYKYHAFPKVSNDIQWTATWGVNLLNDKLTFSGFVDVWTENKHRGADNFVSGKKVVLLTEPQFWYNVNTNLSFGTEVEITNNFYPTYKNRPYINPTIAAKWNF